MSSASSSAAALNQLSDAQFRAEVRAEFETNYPEALRYPSHRLLWREQETWYRRMAGIGWIAPSWPVEFGGMGLSPRKLLIFLEEQERWGIARFQDHGIRMVGPILMQFGTQEQRDRFLPPILSCDHRYCQGYSEPEAGSDLAGIRTVAKWDNDGWTISGTKIWTTMAHDVTHMFLLARTGSDGPKQSRISFFLLALDSPGVTVRTIKDLSGAEELCEVFLDDVFVHAADLIGEINAGWTVAKSILGFERIHVGSPQLPGSGLEMLRRVLKRRDAHILPGVEDRIAQLQLDVDHLALVYEGYAVALDSGLSLESDVSMLKLWATETFQRIADLTVEIAGPAGGASGEVVLAGDAVSILGSYYRARPSTIYGGTSEIQRNILAKHVLKLPQN
jgi:alkylation response protein AidB-like acyl-CoA dehydrogenase